MNINQEYRALKETLNLVSSLKENDKLTLGEGVINGVNKASYLQGIKRTLFNRGNRNLVIEQLDNLSQRVAHLTNQELTAHKSMNLTNLIHSSLYGLENLKVTYKNDSNICKKLDEIINQFKTTDAKFIPKKNDQEEDDFTIIEKAETYVNGQNSLSQQKVLENQIHTLLNPKSEMPGRHIGGVGRVDVELVKATLGKSFGKQIIDDMVKMYGFNDFINDTELNILVMGIVANLTYNDIQDILELPNGQAFEKINDLINIENKQIDKNISEESLINILARLRDVKLYKPQNIDKAIANNLINPQIRAQAGGDFEFLAECKYIEKYKNPKHAMEQAYGHSEQLTRGYVYALFGEGHKFRDGIVFPLYQEHNGENKLVCRRAYEVINKDALMAMGVTPVTEASSNVPSDDISIVFRGTYDLPSVLRDFEIKGKLPALSQPGVVQTGYYDGPGFASYPKYEEELLINFINFYNHHKGNSSTLEIMGHSLGSTDAERFITTLTSDMAKPYCTNDYSNLKNIKLYGYNSPGYSKNDADLFYNNITALNDVHFDVNYLNTDGDIVHTFGTQLPGCCEGKERPSNLSRTFARFNFGSETHGTGCVNEAVSEGGIVAMNENNTFFKGALRGYKAHSLRYFTGAPRMYAFATDSEEKKSYVRSYEHDAVAKNYSIKEVELDKALQNAYQLA